MLLLYCCCTPYTTGDPSYRAHLLLYVRWNACTAAVLYVYTYCCHPSCRTHTQTHILLHVLLLVLHVLLLMHHIAHTAVVPCSTSILLLHVLLSVYRIVGYVPLRADSSDSTLLAVLYCLYSTITTVPFASTTTGSQLLAPRGQAVAGNIQDPMRCGDWRKWAAGTRRRNVSSWSLMPT